MALKINLDSERYDNRVHALPSRPNIPIRFIHIILVLVWLSALTGCMTDDGRQSLDGTVTLDGAPLAEGSILITPMAGTSGPVSGGAIQDGQFSVTSKKGVVAGHYRVEISSTQKSGNKRYDPGLGTEVDEIIQILPARYNEQSELQLEVKEDGPNEYTFELISE